MMNYTLILSRPFSIQGREPYLCDFVTQKNLSHWLVIKRLQTYFFQTWYDRDHYGLRFDINLNDGDLHSRSHLYEKSTVPVSFFSKISQLILMKFSMLPWPAGLWRLMLDLFCTLYSRERTLLML